MKKNKSNIANFITISRVFGVAYIFWLMPFSTEKNQLLIILLFTVVALTDALDGWVARRFKMISEFGKVMDPIADKILILVFLPLVSMGAIKSFPVFLILAREFAVMGLRVIGAKYNFNISASFFGKLKTGITLPICGLLFVRPNVIEFSNIPSYIAPIVHLKRWIYAWPDFVFESLIWVMVLVTILSFFDYLIKFLWSFELSKAKNDEAKAKKVFLTYIPNTISSLNIVCGLSSCILSYFGYLKIAGACILIGMILDGLDGKIARIFNAFSKFGQLIDSRADYITFGFAPAVLLFFFIKDILSYGNIWLALIFSILYFISVRFRLVRFEESGHAPFFVGLPSPIGALFLVVSIFSSLAINPWLFFSTQLINMYLMVSTLQYPHNESANQKLCFRYLKLPVLFFISLVTLRYLYIHSLGIVVNNLLLALMVVYLCAPLIKTIPEKPTSN